MKIIILAGGTGTRLWPFSRTTHPKQFLRFGNENSFLEKTLLRFLKIRNPDEIFIVTSGEHYHLVKSQAINVNDKLQNQIIVEPERKSTGPAIALAATYLKEIGSSDEDCFFVSSSDYYIMPEDRFLDYVKKSEEIARKGKIVIFGVRPNKPETGYGYIKISSSDNKGFIEVEKFIEKPHLDEATNYLTKGGYLWNCGIFTFQIKVFLEEMNKYASDIGQSLKQNYQNFRDNFSKMPEISIDHCLMEKSRNIAVCPMDVEWSDIGSWDSIFEVMNKDQNQNAKIGNVLDIDTKNSLIIGGKRLISTIGLENMVVVDTEDAIFLGKRGESQRVKQLVSELNKMGKKESCHHSTIHRPWGHYTILEENLGYKVKKIVVNPGQKLSLQYHLHRNEHWVVTKGIAQITNGSVQKILHENENEYIPKEAVHRLENVGNIPLEVIEVQTGEYLGEDDIIRIEDVYGRIDSQVSLNKVV